MPNYPLVPSFLHLKTNLLSRLLVFLFASTFSLWLNRQSCTDDKPGQSGYYLPVGFHINHPQAKFNKFSAHLKNLHMPFITWDQACWHYAVIQTLTENHFHFFLSVVTESIAWTICIMRVLFSELSVLKIAQNLDISLKKFKFTYKVLFMEQRCGCLTSSGSELLCFLYRTQSEKLWLKL